MENIGKKILDIRKELGLSQKEFAEKIGIAQNTLSNYELKRRAPNIDFFLTLLNIGVSPLYLFYNIGEPFDKDFDKCLENFKNKEKITFLENNFTINELEKIIKIIKEKK